MELNFEEPGRLVKARRQQRGLSQSFVAEQLGIDKSLLSRVENGTRALSEDEIRKLSDLLDLPDELLRISMGRLPEDVQRSLPQRAGFITTTVRQSVEEYADRLGEGLSADMLARLITSSDSNRRAPRSTIEGRIRAGKNSTTYRAHSYHTKVPPEAIVPIIEHFTEPGDVVLDLFCGSGMTGVAALQVGRYAVLSDLSPAAVHIARNYVTPCDPDAFAAAAERVWERVRTTMAFLYDVVAPDGTRSTVEHTVWSDRFTCPACEEQWSYWEATEQKVGREAGKLVACPRCDARHEKRHLAWAGEEPVVSSMSSEGARRRDEHSPTDDELDLVRQADAAPIPYWTPQVAFGSEREMWRAGHGEMGVRSAADFYTRRNLHALAALRHAIFQEQEPRLRDALLFAFTACLNRASRRYQWNRKRPTNVMTGTLYISSLRYEWNVWSLFRRKVDDARRYYESFPASETRAEVALSSAVRLSHVPDRSIDFVFMDPPFGSNIFYADSSLLWEAWLGRLTPLPDEIVVNRHVTTPAGGKTVAEYASLLERAFSEVRRVLKPGAHAVLAFSNTDDEVWEGIRSAIEGAGLEVTTTAVLDKVQNSIKGVQATLGNERVTRLDLLIGLRAREGAASRQNDGALRPLSTRVVSILAGAGCPLASDEIYTAVLQESLSHSDGLAGLSLSEVERMLGEVATRDSKGRWHMTRAMPRGHAQSLPEAYLFAGASFELQADAAQPKQVQEVPSGAVQGGRNTAFYNAHSYHTKVPPEAIEPFIEHFTRPGDVVLDPFAGSGMTGVAAVLLGRRAVLNDLATVGAHLAYNHTRPCDPATLQRAFDDLYASLLPAFRRWYRTVDDRGRDGYVHYTIWSNIYVCKSCKHRFSMWSVTDTESGRVGRSLQCPSCGHSEARQSWRAEANEPVFISYEVDGSSKRMERKADVNDLAHAQSFRVGDIKEWYPKVEVQPDREMYIRCALHLQGIKTIADFYTPRNLQALATIWDAIQRVSDERIRFALAFAFTNTAWHGTRMRRYNARGGQRPLTGTLYIPQLSSEANVLEVMANKVAQLCSYYRALTPARPEVPLPRILTGSATQLDRVPDASVDYIFTDPPFGSNIFYSDCNLIWEAWLGSVTDDRLEAVVNRSRKHAKGGKTVAEYADLMGRALAEMHRVLKPGGWVTLVFHNTDPEIWVALQESAAGAGFRIDGAAGLDRQQHSHKGYKGKNEAENVAHFDIVLSMQKQALDMERLPRRRVTEAVLKATLTVAAKEDARVLSSLQWAHSVAMRRLFEGGYDLRDVSYERVADTWRRLAGRPG